MKKEYFVPVWTAFQVSAYLLGSALTSDFAWVTTKAPHWFPSHRTEIFLGWLIVTTALIALAVYMSAQHRDNKKVSIK